MIEVAHDVGVGASALAEQHGDIEAHAEASGRTLEELPLEEMEAFWQQAKREQ